MSTVDQLEELVTPNTKIVAITHVSNVLGDAVDVRAVVDLVRRVAGSRARVIVDGVAYAPHRYREKKKKRMPSMFFQRIVLCVFWMIHTSFFKCTIAPLVWLLFL